MQVLSGKKLAAALTVFAITLAMAVQAAAQGFYFKEIRRDDRIYVFNDAARAEAFEKTGEMGTGITKPGVGPKGETVVGDSERALQLFFFKYGISEAVPEPAQPVQRIEWRDGKTRITTSPRESMRMLLPTASSTSMDSVLLSSHGRALKA